MILFTMLVTLGEREQMKVKSFITCCLNCPDRVVGCHSTCQKYIGQKAEHEAYMEIARKKMSDERFFSGFPKDDFAKERYDGRKKDVYKEGNR